MSKRIRVCPCLPRAEVGRAVLPALLFFVVLGCGGAPEHRLSVEQIDADIPVCAEGRLGDREGYEGLAIDTLARGLEVPWDVTFLPDGRALVTERPGRIRVATPDGRLLDEPWAELDVLAVDEVGLMGIDAAPDFEETGHVFVVLTRQDLGSGVGRVLRAVGRRLVRLFDPGAGYTVRLEIVRLTERAVNEGTLGGGEGTEATTLAELPSGRLHGGGALRFGPGGFLYVTTGDTAEPELAADSDALRGKILRYAYDAGEISPAGTGEGAIWAGGIRHAQGLAWHPTNAEVDGRNESDRDSEDAHVMYLIDHGPTGLPQEDGRTGNDELNRVTPGADLGWPDVAGGKVGEGLTPPVATWNPAIAPAGLEFYTNSGASWYGDAFVTALRGRSLRRLEMTPEASAPVGCEEVLLDGTHGRLRLVRQAPDGSLWVGTSNRDGRGRPSPQDDLLLRISPENSQAHASPAGDRLSFDPDLLR